MGGEGDSEVESEPDFEQLYVAAGDDLRAIPWAALAAHSALTAWLDGDVAQADAAALVVGCGSGDDAEALAARGHAVTAFDVAPTAIDRCQQRFPASSVDYRVADLMALPAGWWCAFDLVVEIRTLQSLPVSRRSAAVSSIAGTVRVGGRVFVRCAVRGEHEPLGARPWPVSRAELDGFTAAGLSELTRDQSGAPEAALVGVGITEEAELVFDTLSQSRKCVNLRAFPRVAVVVGWADEVTVQGEGTADVLTGSDRDRCLDAYVEQYPDGRHRSRIRTSCWSASGSTGCATATPGPTRSESTRAPSATDMTFRPMEPPLWSRWNTTV